MMDPNHARIDPVSGSGHRPLWSVLIPCYHCANYLENALASVLAQDPGPESMEIIVVDDCSTKDRPEDVVQRLGGSRVRFVRQASNLGKVRNYETGLQLSRGHLIHQLHGDDLVLPGFYEAMEEAFARFPEAGAFFCESDYIDEHGVVTGRTGKELEETGLLSDWLRKIVVSNRIQTPSVVVRRTVYEVLGGFDRRLDCTEDWEMWVRIACAFPVGFCTEAHAQYRTSSDNTSFRAFASGVFGNEIRQKLFKIVDSYVPSEVSLEINERRSLGQAYFLAAAIPAVLRSGGVVRWWMLCREVLRFSKNPAVIKKILSLTLRGSAAWAGLRPH